MPHPSSCCVDRGPVRRPGRTANRTSICHRRTPHAAGNAVGLTACVKCRCLISCSSARATHNYFPFDTWCSLSLLTCIPPVWLRAISNPFLPYVKSHTFSPTTPRLTVEIDNAPLPANSKRIHADLPPHAPPPYSRHRAPPLATHLLFLVRRHNKRWMPKTPRSMPSARRTLPTLKHSNHTNRERGSGREKRSYGDDYLGEGITLGLDAAEAIEV